MVLLNAEASGEPFNKTTALVCPYYRKNINKCIFGKRSQRAIIDFLCHMYVVCYNVNGIHSTGNRWERLLIFCVVWNTQHGFHELLEVKFQPIKILLVTRTSDTTLCDDSAEIWFLEYVKDIVAKNIRIFSSLTSKIF